MGYNTDHIPIFYVIECQTKFRFFTQCLGYADAPRSMNESLQIISNTVYDNAVINPTSFNLYMHYSHSASAKHSCPDLCIQGDDDPWLRGGYASSPCTGGFYAKYHLDSSAQIQFNTRTCTNCHSSQS